MTLEELRASRKDGRSVIYYADGTMCIHRTHLPDEFLLTVGNLGHKGTLTECEELLHAWHAEDSTITPTGGFFPEIYHAGQGTLKGMCDMLEDYTDHHHLPRRSADELLAECNIPEQYSWLRAYCEIWDDLVRDLGRPRQDPAFFEKGGW
jgi:hypothetical protein